MVNKPRTIQFTKKPSILATAVSAGPLEKKSVFHSFFDIIYEDERFNKKTNEQGSAQLIEDACTLAIRKAGLEKGDINLFLSGDLINQMTPTNFASRELAIPYMGMFSACATSVSSLITASIVIESNLMDYVLFGSSSQHNSVERQFRYPIEYGAQKPPFGQWTVTAAGFGVVAQADKDRPYVKSATVGKVIDCECEDPLDMGSAMAPAAFDTIQSHLQEDPDGGNYDLVITGDLGKTGFSILKQLLETSGLNSFPVKLFRDAGAEFYGNKKEFKSGASGAGCSASVFYGPIYSDLLTKKVQKVLLVATGALLSPLTFQQGETIPCIAHAVEIRID